MYQLQKYWINRRDESENQPVGETFGEFLISQSAWKWANTHPPKRGFTYEVISPDGRLMSRVWFAWER